MNVFRLLSRLISAKIRSFPNRQAAVKSCNMVVIAVDMGLLEESSVFFLVAGQSGELKIASRIFDRQRSLVTNIEIAWAF